MGKRRRKGLGEYLNNAQHQAAAAAESKVRRALLSGSLTEDEIAAQFGLAHDAVTELLREFRAAGANLVRHGDRWRIDKHLAPDSEAAWKVVGSESVSEPNYRFGLIADTHLGSKHARLDVCDDLYDWFAREGIRIVWHCGNWIDGEAHFNRHELLPEAHGMQAQLDLFVKDYPSRKGIETRYVAGDDHEGWYSQRDGVDIGRMLQDTARRAGRRDLTYLGYKEAFVTMEHPRTRRHARMLVDHPGGGSAYATSYAAQKRIESAQGGEKPAVWAFGHWHKSGYFVSRNVHAVLVPCTKSLDTFGRKKGLEYVIGGVILELWQDEGGAIVQVRPSFRLYFDRGYYNQQYNLSGPVERRRV